MNALVNTLDHITQTAGIIPAIIVALLCLAIGMALLAAEAWIIAKVVVYVIKKDLHSEPQKGISQKEYETPEENKERRRKEWEEWKAEHQKGEIK